MNFLEDLNPFCVDRREQTTTTNEARVSPIQTCVKLGAKGINENMASMVHQSNEDQTNAVI